MAYTNPNLVKNNPTLFDSITFGLDWLTDNECRTELKNHFRLQEIVYEDIDEMKIAIQDTADHTADYLNRLYVLQTKNLLYNPIENYDLNEEEEPAETKTTHTPAEYTTTETPAETTTTTTPAETTITDTPAETTVTDTPAETTTTTTPAETTETVTPAETTETMTPAEQSNSTQNNIWGFNSTTNPVPQDNSDSSNTVDNPATTKTEVDTAGSTKFTTDTAGTTKVETDTAGSTKTEVDSAATTKTEVDTPETVSTSVDANGTIKYTVDGDEVTTFELIKKRTLKRHGNIGVTTGAQMLQGEVELAEVLWSLLDIFCRQYDDLFSISFDLW